MIHVKTDKRSQKSAELLVDGFVKCLEQKEFNEITISDLQKASGVSRATFYRLFDNVQDVLAYKCDQLAADIKNDVEIKNINTSKDFFIFILGYWLKNANYIDAVYKCNRGDILQQSMFKHMHEGPDTSNLKLSDKEYESLQKSKEYISAALIGSLSSILLVWIKNGKKESVDELFDIFSNFGHYMSTIEG